MTRCLAVLAGAGVTLLVGCSAQQPASNASPAPVPPALSINAEMVGLVDHAAHTLWDAEREAQAPKSDDDWAELEDASVQLAAAGTVIALGGTGPADAGWAQLPDWKRHALELRDVALLARTAAQGKNLEALVAVNGKITDTCEACHKEFKPELPTERIIHRHRRQAMAH
jgi:hypothetical protein